VGDVPGEVDEHAKKPFQGEPGFVIQENLKRLGIPKEEVGYTYAIACRPRSEPSAKEWSRAVVCCRPRLAAELGVLAADRAAVPGDAAVPSVPVPGLPDDASGSRRAGAVCAEVGGLALKALTGHAKLDSWFGAPLQGGTPKALGGRKSYEIDFSGLRVLGLLDLGTCLKRRALLSAFSALLTRAALWSCGRLPLWSWAPAFVLADAPALAALQRMLARGRPVAVDIETQGLDSLKDKMMCLGLSDGVESVCLPWDAYHSGKWGAVPGLLDYEIGPALLQAIKDLLGSPAPKVFHNGQHDILGLEVAGVHVENYARDTLLCHRIIAPALDHDLGGACATEFPAPRWKTDFHVLTDKKGAEAFVKRDPIVLRTYCATDANATWLLDERCEKHLAGIPRGRELYDSQMVLARLAMSMRSHGIQVDMRALRAHKTELTAGRIGALESLQGIVEHFGFEDEFNPQSPKHLRALFFGHLGLKAWKRTKTGLDALDAAVLEKLLVHEDPTVAEVARAVLEYREVNKLLRTYVDGLPVGRDRTLRPTWRVDGARTGRWSSQSPNVMNVPPEMRDMLVPRAGLVMVGADYSALEARILALLSGDEALLQAIAAGEDIHMATARLVFGPEATREHRALSKTIFFAKVYGSGDAKILMNMREKNPAATMQQAVDLRVKWDSIHAGAVAWIQQQNSLAYRRHWVEIPFNGLRHYFYGYVEPTKVANTQIQGTAAHLINSAIVTLTRLLGEQEKVLLQVHDELVCEGPSRESLEPKMRQAMERTLEWEGRSMRFAVEVHSGANWKLTK